MVNLSLNGRHLFITGGTGFIGKTLLDYLIAWKFQKNEDFQITILSRDPNAFLTKHPAYNNTPWMQFIEGSLNELPPSGPYTDVIHAAADTHLNGQGVQWIDQIVNGTSAILDFARRSGVRRFLHTSSGAVYGAQPPEINELTEDYLGAPNTGSVSSTYGQAKRVAEQLCTIYAHEYGLETVNARCFAFCGKHMPLQGPYALGNFIHDALHSSLIQVKGDGKAVRSYLDGEDMARWLLTLLLTGQAGESYNVGSNNKITVLELARKVSSLLNPNAQIFVENSCVENTQRSIYIPSIYKAGGLGLFQKYDINQSILRAAMFDV